MSRTVRPGRTLTPAQVELVRRWARRQRVVFVILAPVTVVTAVLMGAGGFLAAAFGLHGREVDTAAVGLLLILVSIVLAAVLPWMWKGIARARRASLDTPVQTFGGVYQRSGGRSVRSMFGGTVVTIPADCPGEHPELGRYYEVDVIDGIPPLAVEIRRPVGSRRDRRRRRAVAGM